MNVIFRPAEISSKNWHYQNNLKNSASTVSQTNLSRAPRCSRKPLVRNPSSPEFSRFLPSPQIKKIEILPFASALFPLLLDCFLFLFSIFPSNLPFRSQTQQPPSFSFSSSSSSSYSLPYLFILFFFFLFSF